MRPSMPGRSPATLSGDDQVRRRRECTACKERFPKFELAELTLPRVIKRDGAREPFDDAKLRSGMLKALEKRPVGSEVIEATLSRIKKDLRAMGEREITAQELGEKVMTELRTLDHVAFVRFASVYRSFQDVDDFREAIRDLNKLHRRITDTPGSDEASGA